MTDDDAAATGTLHGRLRALLAALAGMLGDRVLLLSLELRLAGRALGTIVALGVGAAVAVLTAWLGLWLAIGAWILERGGSHAVAALLVIVANGALAAWALLKARTLLKQLTLPATLRTLTRAAATDRAVSPMPPMPAMPGDPEAPVP